MIKKKKLEYPGYLHYVCLSDLRSVYLSITSTDSGLKKERCKNQRSVPRTVFPKSPINYNSKDDSYDKTNPQCVNILKNE